MMFNRLHRNRRGQVFVESLFVIPLLFMLFIFIMEMGFLMYNWAVLNFYTGTMAVAAAAKGQFTDEIRIRLAGSIDDRTFNSQGYNYDISGTDPPADPDDSTVYVYGSDRNTPVQRGSYISVNVNYPWHFNSFVMDGLSRFIVSGEQMRIRINVTVPSEVFIE